MPCLRSLLFAAANIAATLACEGHYRRRRQAGSGGLAPPPTSTYEPITAPFTETIAAIPAPPTPVSGFYNVTLFPNEQKDNVTQFLNEAASLSTAWQIHQYFQDQCITQQVFPSLFSQPAGFVTPFSPFDNLYFVGQGFVSAWAYKTGDGLVVIDALDDAEEVQEIMIPALESFGFSGEDIKHVIITHEHLDHYGGARYLKETYGATIYASDAAWREMATYGNNTEVPPPDRDQTLADGQVMVFGDVWFETVLTPGHTPGTLSLIFPLTEKNGTVSHIAGLNGGTGAPQSAADRTLKIQNHYRLADIAKSRGVDTLISNHQVADHALFNSDLLNHATADSSNPFVVGVDNYFNYLNILALCTKVQAARQGMDLWA